MQVSLSQGKYGKRQALQGTGQKSQALSCLRRARTAFRMNRLAGSKAGTWDPHSRRGGAGRYKAEAEQGVWEFWKHGVGSEEGSPD